MNWTMIPLVTMLMAGSALVDAEPRRGRPPGHVNRISHSTSAKKSSRITVKRHTIRGLGSGRSAVSAKRIKKGGTKNAR